MQAQDHVLDCQSCHRQHQYTTNPLIAGVESCLNCHADQHSLAFKQSAHFKLCQQANKNQAVSCATCHLPRQYHEQQQRVVVQHNANHNLRPRQTMLETCLHCHGMRFSVNALSDQQMIDSNFQGQPQDTTLFWQMLEAKP